MFPVKINFKKSLKVHDEKKASKTKLLQIKLLRFNYYVIFRNFKQQKFQINFKTIKKLFKCYQVMFFQVKQVKMSILKVFD